MSYDDVLKGHRIIDLRDPDDYVPWSDYTRWMKENELWHKRSEAAKKGWETRRKRNELRSDKQGE